MKPQNKIKKRVATVDEQKKINLVSVAMDSELDILEQGFVSILENGVIVKKPYTIRSYKEPEKEKVNIPYPLSYARPRHYKSGYHVRKIFNKPILSLE